MAKVKQPDPLVLTYITSNYYCVDGKIYNSNNKEVCFSIKKSSAPHGYAPLIYSYLQIGNRRYKRSHVVWFLAHGFWPQLDILHKDGDRLNDRIENLEQGTVSERHARRAGSKMYKGFSIYKEKDKKTNPWRVKNYRYSIGLGYFETQEAAKEAVDKYLNGGKQWWGG